MSSVTTTPALPKVGIIVCSTRQPQCCSQISDLVLSTLQSFHGSTISLSLISLSDWDLPLFNEPGVPSQIKDPSQYMHEHTRRWSTEISSFSGFIFVTPQYNWGYPASIKNAIDYLYHEWSGKGAIVVSYGGHGGTKAAAQLQQVLEAVKMKVVKESVNLAFPDRGSLQKAAKGEDLGLLGGAGGDVWAKEMEGLKALFGELITGL